MKRHRLSIMALAAVAGIGFGCSTTEHYHEGVALDLEKRDLIKDGIPKAEVLTLLGIPSDTVFVDPSPEDERRNVRVKETMIYLFSEKKTLTKPPVLGGAVLETGVVQQLDIGLEDGRVAYHHYTEESR